jgi:hypothetical protein
LTTNTYKNFNTEELVEHFFNSTSTAICQFKEKAAQEPTDGGHEGNQEEKSWCRQTDRQNLTI